MVHDDCALLVVNLGVQPGVADQVDNPLLGSLGVETQPCAEVGKGNTGVDLAVALEDEMSGRVDELISMVKKEEVAAEDLLSKDELLLGLLEIEVDAQGVYKAGNGVLVLVGLLLDDADNVLHLLLLDPHVLSLGAVGDNSHGKVAQDPRAVGLDGVDVSGVEEEVEDGLTGLVVVEEGEESPVDEGGPVLQLGEGVLRQLRVDNFADLLNLLQRRLPAHGEDLASQSTPCGVGDLVVVCGKDAEAVEGLSGITVVTAAILKVAQVEEGVDHVDGDLLSNHSSQHHNFPSQYAQYQVLHRAPASRTPSWPPCRFGGH